MVAVRGRLTARKFFILAGEPSGDSLAAGLISELMRKEPGARFRGVGGRLMSELGLEAIFPIGDISVMGIGEVLPRIPRLLARMKQAAAEVLEFEPDALITVDSPDFNFRVARKVKKIRPDLPVVHYVSPTVWAWRPGRAAKLGASVDHVLALFPFEPEHLHSAGIGCTFVGHPAASFEMPTEQDVASLRRHLSIAEGDPVLAVLPGSRASEVSRLCPLFGRALAPLMRDQSELKVVVAAAEAVAGLVQTLASGWEFQPLVLDASGIDGSESPRRKMALFQTADAALAASGTVTLELAAAETPMVVAYDVNWLTRAVLARLLRVDTVTLVNLVNEDRAIPEFLGRDCRPELIGPAVARLLMNADEKKMQQAACRTAMIRLGRGCRHPNKRAADAVLDCLDKPAFGRKG